nr:CDGSH iron-sulfur domain-containing protein [Paludibacter sp. 221]
MEETKNCSCGSAEVIHNGPLVIKSCICVTQEGKKDEEHPQGTAFCRCGHSKNQPYCDGSHMQHPFENK